MAAPTTKIARQAAIREILATRGIRSQAELSDALGDRGLSVTQGTLSRDLVDLGAVRTRGPAGMVYALPAEGDDAATHARRRATAHSAPRHLDPPRRRATQARASRGRASPCRSP